MAYVKENKPTAPKPFLSVLQNPYLKARNEITGGDLDPLALVIVAYLPMFTGPLKPLFLEHPDIPRLIWRFKDHVRFQGVVKKLGLAKVQEIVTDCLQRGYWVSKAKLMRTLMGMET